MLHCSLVKDTKKIFFESTCCSTEEIYEFEKELHNNNLKYDITFSNIKSVPLDIIKTLSSIEDKTTIHTNQRMLWLYLSSLKLKTNFLGSYIGDISCKKELQAICIGGSAGSLEKILKIVQSLPYVDISVFIAIHLLPTVKSNLVGIISKHTNYKVVEPYNSQPIEKNTIYIAPPDFHMVVYEDYIYLSHSASVNYSRPSIDVLFESVSKKYKQNCIAILTCGYGKDGTFSLEELKNNQTEIILEDPQNCEANDILLNAIATNNYDKIYSIEQIEHYLDTQLNTCLFDEEELDKFLNDIYKFYGYDFRNYEKNSLLRRINLTQTTLGLDSFNQLKNLTFSNSDVLDKLLRNFSINVTTFFRNPNVFQSIVDEAIPLFEKKNFIRIWCAGCSSGQEAYSIAILMDKLNLLHKTQIYATDFDLGILMQAKNGLYPISSFEQYSKNWAEIYRDDDLSKWFDITKNYCVVKDYIKSKILFFDHNLATDGSINEFDIVFCRNVLIYFDKVLQEKVFELIYESMFDDGILVLGESELPISKSMFSSFGYSKKNKIFKKVGGSNDI